MEEQNLQDLLPLQGILNQELYLLLLTQEIQERMELEIKKEMVRQQLELIGLKLKSLQQEEEVMEIPFTQEEKDQVEVRTELALVAKDLIKV